LIEVRQVSSRRELTRFINYAYLRNAGDPHWVPPLRLAERDRLVPSKNPFFAHADAALFLARDASGRVAGRIAAIDDRLHKQTHRENIAMFGFFEAATAAAAHALDAVERWAAERGREAVRGPLNPSMNESAGLLIGLRYRSHAHDAAQPAGVCGVHRGGGYGKARISTPGSTA
jgi:hypothetical protein